MGCGVWRIRRWWAPCCRQRSSMHAGQAQTAAPDAGVVVLVLRHQGGGTLFRMTQHHHCCSCQRDIAWRSCHCCGNCTSTACVATGGRTSCCPPIGRGRTVLSSWATRAVSWCHRTVAQWGLRHRRLKWTS
jgi:hypothetical protein